MLKLGRAQGVAIAAALSKNVPFSEYAPRKIKMAITGKGTATKEQVAKMLFNIMKIDIAMPKQLDATDGLAVAVCHALQNDHGTSTPLSVRVPSKGRALSGVEMPVQKKKSQPRKKYSGWETFIAQNLGRVS